LSKERRRILLVDDDPDNNRIFAIALRDNGLEVDTFEDPQLALSAFNLLWFGYIRYHDAKNVW
jgi:DNA-binding response OmpR family regulator